MGENKTGRIRVCASMKERERVGDGRECESVRVGGGRERERVQRWGRESRLRERERERGNGSVCVRETK